MKKINLVIVSFLLQVFITHTFEKVHYAFSNDPIDVVIPCHEKDIPGLERAIESVQQYVRGLRRIIVISSKKCTANAEWFDEKLFPFTKKSIAQEIFQSESIAHNYVNNPKSRIGWIYQQFLKFFAAYYIPNISSNILIVDADVVFLKPITFLQENGAGLYAVSNEHHKAYFKHMAQLLPNFKKVFPQHSGITHHMLFQKIVLDDLCKSLYECHHLEPWKAIARTIPVENNTIDASCLSEYEIYFNFVFSRTDQVKIRPLKWKNIFDNTHRNKTMLKDKDYDYVAVHIWEI